MHSRLWLLFASLTFGAAASGCERGSDDKVKKLEERVERLEQAQKRFDEIDEFVRPALEQQGAKRAAEPDPEAIHAVPIAGNYSHGPEDAAVTVIEAFDFA